MNVNIPEQGLLLTSACRCCSQFSLLCLALVALEDQGLAMNLLKMVHKCPVVLVVLVADNAEEVALRGSLVVELDLIIALATGGGGCSRAAGGAQDRQVSRRILRD